MNLLDNNYICFVIKKKKKKKKLYALYNNIENKASSI